MKKGKLLKSLFLATALATMACKQPNIDNGGTTTEQPGSEPVQNPDPVQNETFRTTTLGGANSGLEIFHWRDEAGSGTHMDDSSAMPRYIKRCGAYTMSQVNALEKSLTPAQKQVWRKIGGENWLNAIKQLNFTVDNIDQIYDTIYNGASDVMCTLTQALPVYPDAEDNFNWNGTVAELFKFVYTFELIANEVYKQSGDNKMTYSTDKAYNEKMNSMVQQLKYCGMTATDGKNDIQNNNCAQIVAIHDQQLTTASNAVGLNFSKEQRARLTNIITSAQPVRQINGYYASTSAYQGTKYKPNFSLHAYKLDDNMEETIDNVYFNLENQNSQMEQ